MESEEQVQAEHPKKVSGLRRVASIGVFLVPLLGVGIWAVARSGGSVPDPLNDLQPNLQKDFCEVIDTAQERWSVALGYSAHPEPLAKARGYILGWRGTRLVQLLNDGELVRWAGRVVGRKSAADTGLAAESSSQEVATRLPILLRIESCSASFVSDVLAPIRPGDPVWEVAAGLEDGDPVLFSGRMLRSRGTASPFDERHRAQGDGVKSLQTPSFGFEFQLLEPTRRGTQSAMQVATGEARES